MDAATGVINSVSTTSDGNVAVTGILGTGEITNLLVWSDIKPGQSTTYGEVDPNQSTTYSDVSTSQSPNWENIAA